ncbi:hypothetical protein X759_32760 [Mesorhizobium sp. LSHC420B00]|nr:hypothetical protein X759_32760 [Mesorhizobium sp. LSHC420B00]
MELPAQSTLAASHHPAVSDPDLLDAFNRDAAVQKWTVPEAAEAATALWGKPAATAIAWCAVSAYCDGRTQEYRFWFRVFALFKRVRPMPWRKQRPARLVQTLPDRWGDYVRQENCPLVERTPDRSQPVKARAASLWRVLRQP